jgi:hypothetical protein
MLVVFMHRERLPIRVRLQGCRGRLGCGRDALRLSWRHPERSNASFKKQKWCKLRCHGPHGLQHEITLQNSKAGFDTHLDITSIAKYTFGNLNLPVMYRRSPGALIAKYTFDNMYHEEELQGGFIAKYAFGNMYRRSPGFQVFILMLWHSLASSESRTVCVLLVDARRSL